MRRGAIAGGFLALLLPFASCGAPRLAVDTDPEDLRLHLDGRPSRSTTPLRLETPYYGTLLLELESDDRSHSAVTRWVDIDPPITPWVFPFDLPVELAARLFGQHRHAIDVQLPPRESRRLDEATVQRLVTATRRAATER